MVSSVLLACFVHKLHKPSDRRINNGDHQHLYINRWYSGDMQLFAKYTYIYNNSSRTEAKKWDVSGQICERMYRTHSRSIELANSASIHCYLTLTREQGLQGRPIRNVRLFGWSSRCRRHSSVDAVNFGSLSGSSTTFAGCSHVCNTI